MKFSVVFLTIFATFLLGLEARSARMVFYRSAPIYYGPRPSPAARQRVMYVQYVHPHQRNYGEHRLPSNRVSAFVTGDTVSTGTYIQEQGNPQEEEIFHHAYNGPNQDAAVSTAQAFAPEDKDFPNEYANDVVSETGEIDEPIVDAELPVKEKHPKEFNYNNNNNGNGYQPQPEYGLVATGQQGDFSPQFDSNPNTVPLDNVQNSYGNPVTPIDEQQHFPSVAGTVIPPYAGTFIPTTLKPSPPSTSVYVPPKKKIRVELETPSEEDQEEDGYYGSAYVPQNKRPTKRPSSQGGSGSGSSSSRPQLPSGVFFPIRFDGTNGSAIAIANSFSTGEGGSATSHATAYGSPESRFAARKGVARQRNN